MPDEDSLRNWYYINKKNNKHTLFPYWAKLWPSAIALASFLLNNITLIKNKEVLELAAGLGLPSFAIAEIASKITISDYAADAVAFLKKQSIFQQCKHIHFQQLSWHHLPENISADVVLLSDVNYEPAEFGSLLMCIQQLLEQKITIILATPQRLMAKEFVQQCLVYSTNNAQVTITNNGKEEVISIFVLQ